MSILEVTMTAAPPPSSAARIGWKRPKTALALLAASSALLAAPPALAPAPAPANVTPALAELAAERATRPVDVIVQFSSTAAAQRGAERIRLAGGTPGDELELIAGLQARMAAAEAVALAAQPGVHAVTLNGSVEQSGGLGIETKKILTAFNHSIGSPKAWNDDDGESGRGVGVAVIDTGIAGDLADFRRSEQDPTSRVVASAVVHPDATNPGDQVGHGTHVAGLIAGNGNNRGSQDLLDKRYMGVAPEADLINVKASDDQGNTTVADVINGLQFVVDKKATYNIKVANLSLTSTVAQSYTIDPLAAAAEQAHFAGILVVAASGNSGPNSVNFAPGNDPYVLSVGGADDRGTKSRKDDVIASWTSTGVTQDGFRKPEVMAPGAKLVSTLAPGSAYAAQCPTCVVSGQYLRLGGTSMAAGVVSGAAAILAQVNPAWTPDELKGALINTSRNVPGTGTQVSVDRARGAEDDDERLANVGLVPNTLINPATGRVDPTRAKWGGFDWQAAADGLRAKWGGASFVCSCAKITGLAETDSLRAKWGGADPTRAKWSGVDTARAKWGSVGWSTSFTR
ncbi:MAG: S8 family serine peptidase [Actinomycetota bacterium]|nr:S8 family serine peptidase [Actinomycetota bacterium]